MHVVDVVQETESKLAPAGRVSTFQSVPSVVPMVYGASPSPLLPTAMQLVELGAHDKEARWSSPATGIVGDDQVAPPLVVAKSKSSLSATHNITEAHEIAYISVPALAVPALPGSVVQVVPPFRVWMTTVAVFGPD